MTSQRGMTLVELLVVVAIMMLLVAVGAPMLRPMLEKQGASQGAQSLRVMLLRARNMAVEKGMPFALRLERVQDVNVGSTHAAVKLSIWRESPTIGTAHDSNAGMTPAGTDIRVHQWISGTGWDTGTVASPSDGFFSDGMEIQFFGSGEVYTVKWLKDPADTTVPPDRNLGTFYVVNEIDPVTPLTVFTPTGLPAPWFVVKQQPPWLPTSVPPLLMPEGICVDLEFSGIGKSGTQFTGLPDDVLIWFLADGSVDRVEYNSLIPPDKCDGLVHFLIGSWEQVKENIGTISEDPSTNLELPANIWVTLDPRSGRVVINEIKVPSAPGDIATARTFANEIWNEVAAPR